jgi:hypothetical protein
MRGGRPVAVAVRRARAVGERQRMSRSRPRSSSAAIATFACTLKSSCSPALSSRGGRLPPASSSSAPESSRRVRTAPRCGTAETGDSERIIHPRESRSGPWPVASRQCQGIRFERRALPSDGELRDGAKWFSRGAASTPSSRNLAAKRARDNTKRRLLPGIVLAGQRGTTAEHPRRARGTTFGTTRRQLRRYPAHLRVTWSLASRLQ